MDDSDPHIFMTVEDALDPKRLQLIGFIATYWSSIEFYLKILTRELGGLPTKAGDMITIDMMNVSLITLARNFLSIHKMAEDNKKRISDLLDLIDECRMVRNETIHPPIIPSDDDKVFFGKASYKSGQGRLTGHKVLASPEYLNLIMDAFVFVFLEIVSEIEVLSGRERSLSQVTPARSFIEMLRSRHPSVGKRQSQPRSSQA